MWATWPARISPDRFRREGDYLAQLHAGNTIENYRAAFEYISSIDRYGYLASFPEDDAFGAIVMDIGGRKVTRDLLDSILEIYFLHEMGFDRRDAFTVLDIGAGYGRLAHRLTYAFPRAFVYCTDAIPQSSEICQRYLRYRGVARAVCISAESILDRGSIDLAVNVHSWSECTLGSIRAWLDIIDAKHIKRLFVVPHTPVCATIETDGSNQQFLPAILERFALYRWALKFPPSVHGQYPTAYMGFERKDSVQ